MAKREPRLKWFFAECPTCRARTTFNVQYREDIVNDEGDVCAFRLARCQICDDITLFGQDVIASFDDNTEVLGSPYRLWPSEQFIAPEETPFEIRISLSEAHLCFKADAYTSTVVMCGRALEGICKHQQARGRTLSMKLKDLHDRGVIDDLIYEWADILRNARNIGAHNTEREFHENDANDTLAFLIAICDYIYRLSVKYRAFKERLAEEKEAKTDA